MALDSEHSRLAEAPSRWYAVAARVSGWLLGSAAGQGSIARLNEAARATEQTAPKLFHLMRRIKHLGRRAFLLAVPGRGIRQSLRAYFGRLAIVRFLSANLLRRILASNLIGLAILLGGILYVSQHHAWLIESKVESLKVQGEIIAKAIAAEAREHNGSLVIDPEKLPEVEGSRAPFRDDGFAALEMTLKPERVGPILRRLITPVNTRARIYDQNGKLVTDTTVLLQKGQPPRPDAGDDNPRTRNFWTRLTYWLIDKELPVYKEIGSANGTAYPEVRLALTGSTTPMLLLSERGEQIVSVAVPIQRQKRVQGVLLLSTKPGEIDSILHEERKVIFWLAALALLATIVVSLVLARTVAGPMRRLSAAAEHVSRNISARQDLPRYEDRRDEVGQMAAAFGAMTASLFRRIESSEKFAADVAHELKNPLTAARSTAESLAYAKTEAQRDQLVAQIQNELKRLNRLITDVAAASRLDAELARQQMEPISVTSVLTNVTDIFRDMLSGDTRQIALILEPAPHDGAYVVNGHDGRLGQVMTNLIDNALSFSPDNGTVTVRVRWSASSVEVVVEDEGPGIPEDRLKMVFDRFYTDRPATEAKRGKNSGLGLSISKEIIHAHGGEIWAENRYQPGQRAGAGVKPLGARFVVRLPAAHATAPRGGSLIGRRI